MNIFISGYYGFGNLGDELLLLKVLRDISCIVKASFFVWTSDPNYTVNFLEKRYPVTPIYRYDSQATIKAIQNSDLVIVGSGGLIQEYYTIDLSHWFTNFGVGIVSYALPALIGKIFKKPIFYWALGHGPLFTTTGKLFASWFYSLAECITLRDALSFSQVKELQVDPQKIFLDTDPLLDPKEDLSSFLGALPEREDHLLGISLRNWYTTDQLLEALLSSLLRLLETKKDLRLSLIPAHPAEDLEIHRKLFSALPEDRVSLVEERDPLHLAREILRCHWFVGMRLHAVILSARAGIPTLVLSYDQKTNSFAKEYNLSYLEALPQRFAEIDLALERLLDSNSCKLPTLRDYLTPAIFKNFLTEKEIIKEEREVKSDNLNTNHRLDASKEEILALENLVHQREYYFRENIRLQYLTKELTAERDRLMEELRDAQEKNKEQEEKIKEQEEKIREQEEKIKEQEEKIKEQELELKQAKQRLNEIYDSNFWKLARFYYQLRDKSLLRYLYKYYSPILNRLFRKKGIIYADHESKVIELLRDNSPKFFLFYPIEWGHTLFSRPHHFALNLAKRGYKVFFMSPNLSGPLKYEQIKDNLYIVEGWREYKWIINESYILLGSTDSFISIDDLKKFKARRNIVIYDYSDEIAPEIGGDISFILKRHREISPEVVDFICVVSRKLFEECCKTFPKEKILYLPNACDYEHFAIEADRSILPDVLKPYVDTGKPIIGYYGSLAEWIDYELINYIAEKRPDWLILLIGIDYDGSIKKLKPLPNIVYLGPVNYKDLPRYALWFDVALIPFRPGEVAKATSPIKLFEYMALGKVVVYTSDLEECKFFETPLELKSREEAVSVLEKALQLSKDSTYLNKIRAEAKEQTWEKRVENLLEILSLK